MDCIMLIIKQLLIVYLHELLQKFQEKGIFVMKDIKMTWNNEINYKS